MLLRLSTVSVLLLAGLPACDANLELENGRARVTWVEATPLAAERAGLTVWVQDVEGEPVDVAITWQAGSATGALVLAPGSAPLLGLTTELGLNTDHGQAHQLLWDLTGLPAGSVDLTLTVDDRPGSGDDGDTYQVIGVDPHAGSGPTAATLVK